MKPPETAKASGPSATAVATITEDYISQLTLTAGGSGYTGPPDILFNGGGGVGALAVATVTSGSVTALNLISKGRQYTSAPTVTISMDGGPALLSYGILPNPNPLQVPQSNTQFSNLTLNVSNPGSAAVYCAAIVVTLPGPSEYAQDLTDSFIGIGVVVPLDSNNNPLWTSSQDGGIFTLSPVSQAAGTIAGAGLHFIFDNILVNDSVGTCQVQIQEAGSTSVLPYGTRIAPNIPLQKWPPQFSMVGPTANPVQVSYNVSTQIGWSVVGSNVTCQLLYDPDGNGIQTFNVPNSGPQQSLPLTNPNGVIFTLQATCPVPGQSQPMIAQQQVAVSVTPNPIINLSITPNPVVSGQPVTFTLAWTLEDVTNFQITANDGPNGNTYTLPVPFSNPGSYIVEPRDLNVIYTMTVLSTANPLSETEKSYD